MVSRKSVFNSNIKLKELKQEEKPVIVMNDTQLKNSLKIAEPYLSVKMRTLLAFGTGLRRGDIDSLEINDIDFERNTIAVMSSKTKKRTASRPVSAKVIEELLRYVCSLDIS